MLLDLLTVVVLAWFGSRLFVSLRRSLQAPSRSRTRALVAGLRLRHFLPVPLVITAVLLAALALLTFVPPTQFGWWTAIGGQGNPAFGVTDRTAGTALAIVIPVVFVAMLLPALPLLVEREEQLFRFGAEQWSAARRAWKALVFGLVHAVVGVPIGVALALSIGGAWFTWVYLRAARRGGPVAGLVESTRAHLAYDLVIIAIALPVLAYVVLTDGTI